MRGLGQSLASDSGRQMVAEYFALFAASSVRKMRRDLEEAPCAKSVTSNTW